jgi:hypothetical protein
VGAAHPFEFPTAGAEFAAKLKAASVRTAINYPKPLHPQTAYRHFPGWLVGCIAAPPRKKF